MKIRTYSLIYLFLLVYPQKTLSQIPEKLDRYLEGTYQNHVIPGFAVVIVKGDSIIYKEAFGKERSDKNSPFSATTVSAIGSLTKSITAIAILQMVEKGMLDLDEAVVKYLPQFRTANRAVSDKVTVRMLLNNTSGLKGNPPATMEPSSKALELLCKSLKGTFLTREPGVSYEYSNTGFSIAGLIINRLTGLRFEDYIAKNIFIPLEMTNTIMGVDSYKSSDLLNGHYLGLEPLPANNSTFAISGEYVPAGSLSYATAEDLGNYLIALLNNGRFGEKQLLTEKSIEQLFTSNINFQGLSKKNGGDGKTYGYGLGWMISTIDGREIVHHGGSTGAMSSYTMLDRKKRTAVSLLFNLDLTFIDKHKYIPHYAIANNLLHIVNDEKLSSYGIPISPGNTQNNFKASSNEKGKYVGEYKYSQGGLPWMNFGLTLKVFLNDEDRLMAKVFRADELVGEFEIDLVNPGSAETRNIGLSEQMRFYFSSQGNVKTIQWQGRLYEKRKRINELGLFAHNLKKNKILHLPIAWTLEETEYGFKAINSTDKSIIIGYLGDSKKLLKNKLSEAYPINKKGSTTMETVSVVSWQKQSFEIGKERLLTVFESMKNSNKMFILLDSASSEHTKILGDVVNDIIDQLSLQSI